MPDDIMPASGNGIDRITQQLQNPFQRMLDAGMLPRQIAAVTGIVLQREAQGFYSSIRDEAGFRRAIDVAYRERDKMVSNTIGFRPTEEMQQARRTEPNDTQREAASASLAPVLLEVRKAVAEGTLDRRTLEAMSMAILAASNGTRIGDFGPEDGKPYLDAMVRHSLNYLPASAEPGRRLTQRPSDGYQGEGR